MRLRLPLVLLLLAIFARADVISDVRSALTQGNLPAAESIVSAYQASNGTTSEYAEAASWIARAALAAKQLALADTYAGNARSAAVQLLKSHELDSDPHLCIAMGAAIEVHAGVLAAQGRRAQALASLKAALQTYRNTSIASRIQKNINVLTLVGRPAPPLQEAQYIGARPKPLAQLKGSAVLLFFWAHWCPDCKLEGPIVTRLKTEYGLRGLTIIAPTQLYGSAAYGEPASPKSEMGWIDAVRQRFYSGLLDVPVPVSKANFDAYGASTTPTIVVINTKGVVDLYHPGAMPYDDLRAAIEKALGAAASGRR
ncbi:MAG TPA: TlpA disulfide reductase family protein [Terriglobales bacterium]|nr:TlpA disulfide reductase family protein [Terriglobales bacterium]